MGGVMGRDLIKASWLLMLFRLTNPYSRAYKDHFMPQRWLSGLSNTQDRAYTHAGAFSAVRVQKPTQKGVAGVLLLNLMCILHLPGGSADQTTYVKSYLTSVSGGAFSLIPFCFRFASTLIPELILFSHSAAR